jgi:hypothetical protein
MNLALVRSAALKPKEIPQPFIVPLENYYVINNEKGVLIQVLKQSFTGPIKNFLFYYLQLNYKTNLHELPNSIINRKP